ncbi:MAG: hypothetical protein ACYTGC_19070, partial [Planctomycetota bacterium]
MRSRLTARFPSQEARFGAAVALDGDTAVVGSFAGSAYVFVENLQQRRLTAGDASPFDRFGLAVGVSADTVVVGAYFDDHGGHTNAGSVYVFLRSGAAWNEVAKLTAYDAAAGDRFGAAVAVSGDTIAVGAPRDDHSGRTDAGSVYVFVRSGASWVAQTKLLASDAATGDFLGDSVSISDDLVVAGAPFDGDGGPYSGSAYVFERSGTTWSPPVKLTASDAAAHDYFGRSVDTSDGTAVVGAPGDDLAVPLSNEGSGYLFARDEASWVEQAKLVASDAAVSDEFGAAVATADHTVLVGAVLDDHAGVTHSGSAYVFERNRPPTARCRDVVVDAGPACTGDASVDDGSFDPDGDPITTESSPEGPYGLGTTSVTLTVTDDQGASASCMAEVTVQDTTAPSLTVALDPDTLWPPNHHMVAVEAAVVAGDNCGVPALSLASLTSNEADDAQGIGDGTTTADIQPGADDL